ncbi:MAG TPA: integrase arm-type DNA-binding domain-containing protein [Methylocella sp.]|nr:integrase arm-type DNA-binding domain-containing protein [Methylocella sp.]
MSDSNGYKLTALKVARLKTPGRYGDGHGLYLRIAEYPDRNGKPLRSRNWVFRFERDGAERWMGLGALHTLSLAEARSAARENRRLLLQGVDPINARKAQRHGAKLDAARGTTFRQCAEAYIKAHRAGWRSAAHAEQWPASLERFAYPHVGHLPVSAIDTALVLKVLEPIWSDVTDTASRLRGRIKNILDWAKVREYRDGENPARWRGHLDKLLPKVSKVRQTEHHAAMPYAEVPTFMAELRARDEISARALEFTILCGARTNETLGAPWSEIDLRAKLWRIPAERMKKSDKPHTVPLSDRAIEILEALPRVAGCPYLFPGAKAGQSLSHTAMLKILRGMRPGLTVHGFRSTFRDWAGDCTNHAHDVVEVALAHVVKSPVERAYRRGTALLKRTRLMADWSRYLAKPTARKARDNVVAIR